MRSEMLWIEVRATRRFRRRHFDRLLEELAIAAFAKIGIAEPDEFVIQAQEVLAPNGRRRAGSWLVRVFWSSKS